MYAKIMDGQPEKDRTGNDSIEKDDLSSERGVDYTRLQKLLQQQRWKDADGETHLRMLEAIGREKEGWFRVEDLKNFPSSELRTIDQLWVKYSQGQFGFSVQKQIWLDLGGKLDDCDWETYLKLSDRLGWSKDDVFINYKNFTFNTNAPQGHLPGRRCEGKFWVFRLLGWMWGGGMGAWYIFLFSKL